MTIHTTEPDTHVPANIGMTPQPDTGNIRPDNRADTEPAMSGAPDNPIQGPDTDSEGPDIRARLAAGVANLRRVWVGEIPSLWSAAPATGPELVRYAEAAEWCGPDAVRLRKIGVLYCRLVGIPASMALYGTAWFLQRPARGGALTLLIFMLWVLL